MQWKAIKSVPEWLEYRKVESQQTCVPIAWKDSRAWKFRDGALRHSRNHFFSVLGIQASSNVKELDGVEQIIIDQPEVGLLGFLLSEHQRQKYLLVQAKAEPGNVGDVQIAPTVQATVCNYSGAHGGLPVPCLEHFLNGKGVSVSESLQSEQGTGFLGKYNRNVVVRADWRTIQPPGGAWEWCSLHAVLNAMTLDFAVNTDARSVLVSTDWRALAGNGRPFTRLSRSSPFARKLAESFASAHPETPADLLGLKQALTRKRANTEIGLALKPLDQLRAHRFDGESLLDSESGTTVRPYAVRVRGREVASWDQPLVHFPGVQQVALICQIRNGILCFLLRMSAEVGFVERVQFGPSVQTRAGLAASGSGRANRELLQLCKSRTGVRVRARCMQSDEGGRFYRSISSYSVVEIDEQTAISDDESFGWVTLAQLQTLSREQGMLTNEARSAVSLLLPFL